MTALLDPRAADLPAKLCGLFGSDHAGERASAAVKADALLRAHGLTWFDVLAKQPDDSIEALIDCAVSKGAGSSTLGSGNSFTAFVVVKLLARGSARSSMKLRISSRGGRRHERPHL